jgi:ankyrin repeat protein
MNNDLNTCLAFIIDDSGLLTKNPHLASKPMIEHFEEILRKTPYLVNSQNSDGMTLLMVTANMGRPSYLKPVLEFDKDINKKNIKNNNYTALDYACNKDIEEWNHHSQDTYFNIIKMLCDAGAIPSTQTFSIIDKEASIPKELKEKVLEELKKVKLEA